MLYYWMVNGNNISRRSRPRILFRHRMHTYHFGNVPEFFEIDGQLLEIRRSSIDVSWMHKLVHRHFWLVYFDWFLVDVLRVSLSFWFETIHIVRYTRVELSICVNVKLTISTLKRQNLPVASEHSSKSRSKSFVSATHHSMHSTMIAYKFIIYIAIALVAPTNGNTDDDLLIDSNGYLAYCPCMGEFQTTHEIK